MYYMNLTKKVCPSDKILNPSTSRCVSRTSKLGKSILQQPQEKKQEQPKHPPTKMCPDGKILNPSTSRCVSKTTKLGKSILEKQIVAPAPQQQQQPQKKQIPAKVCPEDKVLNPSTLRCVNKTSKLGRTIMLYKQPSNHSLPLPLSSSPSPSPSHSPPPSLFLSLSPSPSHSKSSSSLKRKKASVIARFMRRTKHARKATALNAICSDSGVCIAFGTKSDEIKKFFNGFSSFDYVENFVMAGVPSNNGFIYAVTYKHRGYAAHAILKSSAKPTADNLMYEYAVGRQINSSFYNKFPIFVETYDYYYKYPSEAVWRSFKSRKNANKLKDVLVPYDDLDYGMSCRESKHICILIQHINDASTLWKMFDSISFIQTELINSLYQIYFSLSAIKNRFTHYDLHGDNVLVYTPNKDKYIEYHFHTLDGEVITFKSQHLIKMIDYGRSYMKDLSEDIRAEVCAEKSCKPGCGSNKGYWMDNNAQYFINSAKPNVSHDLILINYIQSGLINIPRPANTVENILHSELSKVIYTERFGTAEIPASRLPAKIANVSDAELVLRRMLKSGLFKATNDNYMNGYTKMGDLTVYADGRDM
jgi:hypothetical protein